MPETETIDKLFLELSHVTKARTLRENVYAKAISETIVVMRSWMHRDVAPKDVQQQIQWLRSALVGMGDDCAVDNAD